MIITKNMVTQCLVTVGVSTKKEGLRTEKKVATFLGFDSWDGLVLFIENKCKDVVSGGFLSLGEVQKLFELNKNEVYRLAFKYAWKSKFVNGGMSFLHSDIVFSQVVFELVCRKSEAVK